MDTKLSRKVTSAMGGTFEGPEWSQVERLCFNLARAGIDDIVASLDDQNQTVIKCQAKGEAAEFKLLFIGGRIHRSQVATPIQQSAVKLSSPDFWAKVYRWVELIAHASGRSQEVSSDLSERNDDSSKLYSIADEIRPEVANAFFRVTGDTPDWGLVHLGFSAAMMRQGSIGMSFLPALGISEYTVVAIHPKARQDWGYVRDIVKHEMIHIALGLRAGAEHHHGEYFQRIAHEAGLPERYRK